MASNATIAANVTVPFAGGTESSTFAGNLLKWTGIGDWGIIASGFPSTPLSFATSAKQLSPLSLQS